MDRIGKARGQSLVELLFTTLLVSVLVSAAVPSFDRLRARLDVRIAAERLQYTLMRARERAVVRGLPVVVCPSPDGSRCADDPAWEEGWIVFHDRNGDRERDDAEPVEEREEALERQVAVRASRGRVRLRFDPAGHAPGTNVTLEVCDPRGRAPGRALILANSGRVRTRTTDEGCA